MTTAAVVPYYITDAEYAVAFYIPSDPPFQALDLSYVLSRFMDKYIRSSDYTRFNLIAISFQLEHNATYGLLLFDKGLRKTFRKAQRRSRSNPKYNSAQFDIPISTWPNDCTVLRDPQIIFNLKEHAE